MNQTFFMISDITEQPHVLLVVYNILGREVVRSVDQVQSPGPHSTTWNARDSRDCSVSSGLYLYRLGAENGFVETRRMTLLKQDRIPAGERTR